MKEKEFNLSKKAVKDLNNNPIPNYYWEHDVKEFIKIDIQGLKGIIKHKTNSRVSKEDIIFMIVEHIQELKKRAGDDLK